MPQCTCRTCPVHGQHAPQPAPRGLPPGMKTFAPPGTVPAPRAPRPAVRMTLPEALRCVLPLGRHRGKTVDEVARVDRSWLRWASETLDGQAGEACRCVRDHIKAAEADLDEPEPTVAQDDSLDCPW